MLKEKKGKTSHIVEVSITGTSQVYSGGEYPVYDGDERIELEENDGDWYIKGLDSQEKKYLTIYLPTSRIPDDMFKSSDIDSASTHGIQTIGNSAFAYTKLGAQDNRFDGIVTIGNQAFLESIFQSTYLGSSVRAIGVEAFSDSSGAITIDSVVPPSIGEGAFSNNEISVPEAYLQDYKQAWSEYESNLVGY